MAKNKNRDGKTAVAQAPPAKSPTTPAASAPSRSRASGPPVIMRWFVSPIVRHASAMRKHVQKLLNHQRDILSPQAVEAVQTAIRELKEEIDHNADRANLEKQMENLERVAGKWIKPYPNPAWRENVEVLLVALAVAMGIRTFFLQPFKIPTGSMQPTLYGVTSQVLDPKAAIPTGWQRAREWFEGVSYLHVVAAQDEELKAVEPPFKLLIFNIFQNVVMSSGKSYMLWFPPDYGNETLERRAHISPGQPFRKGEDIVRLKVVAGDHLFVDRVTYNFRPPERGEIIVFETKGIPEERRNGPQWYIPPDQFYIKRLVALGGERVQIGSDRHLIINGKHLDSSTAHFEKVYSFDPKDPPQESHYSGHVDSNTPYFRGKTDGVEVPPGQYMVMGDNTMNSLDSRYWGPFPAEAVIGKGFFVYWPITERFGVGYHR